MVVQLRGTKYLEREMKDQGITKDSEVIVYDYSGEQAKMLLDIFKSKV